MKALIDSLCPISYVSGWAKIRNEYIAIYTAIPNSSRVCQIEPDNNIFGVADTLFWQDCTEEVTTEHYFDMQDKQFKLIPQPEPHPNQPVAQGVQTI